MNTCKQNTPTLTDFICNMSECLESTLGRSVKPPKESHTVQQVVQALRLQRFGSSTLNTCIENSDLDYFWCFRLRSVRDINHQILFEYLKQRLKETFPSRIRKVQIDSPALVVTLQCGTTIDIVPKLLVKHDYNEYVYHYIVSAEGALQDINLDQRFNQHILSRYSIEGSSPLVRALKRILHPLELQIPSCCYVYGIMRLFDSAHCDWQKLIPKAWGMNHFALNLLKILSYLHIQCSNSLSIKDINHHDVFVDRLSEKQRELLKAHIETILWNSFQYLHEKPSYSDEQIQKLFLPEKRIHFNLVPLVWILTKPAPKPLLVRTNPPYRQQQNNDFTLEVTFINPNGNLI